MTTALTVVQGLGVLAVLLGVVLLLPLGGALVVDGVLAAAVSVVAEYIVRGRPAAPSDGRSGLSSSAVQ